jgi:hypothetical protein
MRMRSVAMSLVLTSALVGLSGTAFGRDLDARDRDVRRITLGAQFQYGIWTGDGDVNLYGPGVGIRGGFTLDPGLYLGANFDYFAGEKIPGTTVRANVYDFVGEIGYDFWVHPNGILRPKIGLGLGVAKVGGCASIAGVATACDSRSENGLAIAPGIQYLHFLSAVYLSLEARYQTISLDGPDPSALILGAGIGAAF